MNLRALSRRQDAGEPRPAGTRPRRRGPAPRGRGTRLPLPPAARRALLDRHARARIRCPPRPRARSAHQRRLRHRPRRARRRHLRPSPRVRPLAGRAHRRSRRDRHPAAATSGPRPAHRHRTAHLAPTPRTSGLVPGTGPYRIARFVPGRLLELQRNPSFAASAPAAQPTGAPDRIVWHFGGSPSAAVAAVLRGEAVVRAAGRRPRRIRNACSLETTTALASPASCDGSLGSTRRRSDRSPTLRRGGADPSDDDE